MKNQNEIVKKIKEAIWRLALRELGGGLTTFSDFNKRILAESEKVGEILEKAIQQAGISKEDKERLFSSNVATPLSKEDLDLYTKVFDVLMRWQQQSKSRK